MSRLTLSLIALILLSASPVHAAERITDYDAQITVHADGSMDVTETISVVAEGDEIKRGIFRDFPTTYPGGRWLGRIVTVPFDVVEVTRDGKPEPYHTAKKSNGVRIYVGDANTFVTHGPHTYTIHYRTDRQLGFFDTHDELYWNVTGNGWAFPIDIAHATVTLPDTVPMNEVKPEGFVGLQGSENQKGIRISTGNNASCGTGAPPVVGPKDPIETHDGRDARPTQDRSSVEFATTTPLGPREGLTVVVAFPKGHVAPTNFWRVLFSDPALLAVIAGIVVVLGYYLVAWFLVGKDPPRSAIVPQWDPPMALSPAALRYVWKMRYDPTCFTVTVLDLAIKKWITIEERGKTYTLRREPTAPDRRQRTEGEVAVMARLLKTSSSIELKNKNHKRVSEAINALRSHLKSEFNGVAFHNNRKWLIPGVLLSLGAIVWIAMISGIRIGEDNVMPMVLLGFFSLFVFPLFKGFATNLTVSPGKAAAMLFPILLLAFMMIPTLYFAAGRIPLWLVVVVIVLGVVNWVFFAIIKRPTAHGQWLRDQVEGFRVYLSKTEAARIDFDTREASAAAKQGPSKTIELFETYLPYAVALGVENEWSAQFEDVIKAASLDPTSRHSTGYIPYWYAGNAFDASRMGNTMSGLTGGVTSAISSASTAPGSSSGSSGFSGGGGGGFSGGGGGGGGGGGW